MTLKKKRPWELNRLALDVATDALEDVFSECGKSRCVSGRVRPELVRDQITRPDVPERLEGGRKSARTPRIIKCLVKGSTIARTAVEARVSTDMVARQAVNIGRRAAGLHHDTLLDLDLERVAIHTQWAFSYGLRSRYLNPEGAGAAPLDLWLWTASDPETGLVINWAVGSRGGKSAMKFIEDTMARLKSHGEMGFVQPVLSLEGRRQASVRALTGGLLDAADRKMLTTFFGASQKWAEGVICLIDTNLEKDLMGGAVFSEEIPKELAYGLVKRVSNLHAVISLHITYSNLVRIPSCGCEVPAVANKLLKRPLTHEQLCERLS